MVSGTPTAEPIGPIDNTFGALLIGNYVGLMCVNELGKHFESSSLTTL